MKECFKCGHVNQPADNKSISSSECPVCGIIYKKYEDYLFMKKVKKEAKSQPDEEIHEPSPDRLLSRVRNSIIVKWLIEHKSTLAYHLHMLWIMGCGYWLYKFIKISVTPQRKFLLFTPGTMSSRESITILFFGIFAVIFIIILALFLFKFVYNLIKKEIMLFFPKELHSFIAPLVLLTILFFFFLSIENIKIGGFAAYYNINELVNVAKNHSLTLEIKHP